MNSVFLDPVETSFKTFFQGRKRGARPQNEVHKTGLLNKWSKFTPKSYLPLKYHLYFHKNPAFGVSQMQKKI